MTPTYQICAWFTSDLLDDFGVWSFLEESSISSQLGGGFKYFYFHPYLGKISNLTNIFQMGWNQGRFDHRLQYSWHLQNCTLYASTSEQWKTCLFRGFFGDDILPSYVGVVINHYKDPY